MPAIIHRYLQKCFSNPQPPGFADFLRGTLTLFYLAPFFQYDVKIDYTSHPVFDFLKHQDEFDAKDISCPTTFEFIPPMTYEAINDELVDLFAIYKQKEESFAVLTNAYPLHNCLEDAIEKMRRFLEPTPEIQSAIESFKNENFNNEYPYAVIHIRMGDQYIGEDKTIDQALLNKILDAISGIQTRKTNDEAPENFIFPNSNFIVLTESFALKKVLQEKNILTSDGIPVHLGEVITSGTKEKIKQTMIDFYLLRNALCIYFLSPSYGTSGFSRMINTIFDVPIILHEL